MEKDLKKVTAAQVSQETESEKKKALYNQYVGQMTPKHSWFKNLCRAWLVGGLICVLGQALTNLFISQDMQKDQAASYTTICLILLAIIFTGFGWYQRLAKFAGAGSVVPITGFANSVAAPAIEFKKEGQVFGIGCKIFNIAGPVILYGIFSSWLLGVIYWIWTLFQ